MAPTPAERRTLSDANERLAIKGPHIPVDELRERPAVCLGRYEGIVEGLDSFCCGGRLSTEEDRRPEAERVNDHQRKEAPSGPAEQPLCSEARFLVRVHGLNVRRSRWRSSLVVLNPEHSTLSF